MIPQGIRGDKRGWHEVQIMKMRFRELLCQFKSDKEIMKELGLKRRTFYRYKSIIYKEDKEIWSKVMIEPLESRALKIYQSLEESCRINRQIALNEKAKPMDRIKASKGMVNAQYNILKLLKMGPNANFEYYEII
jgi:ACT domain-containing protein